MYPVFLFLFIFLLVIPAYCTEDIRKSDLNDEIIKDILDKGSATNTTALDELERQENVLAVYGIIPKKNAGEEAYEWWLTLDKIITDVATDKSFKKEYISSIGSHTDGYIYVKIKPEEAKDIKAETMDSIQEKIAEYATKNCVDDVPIVIKIANPVYTFESIIENSIQTKITENSPDAINSSNGYKKNPYGGLLVQTSTHQGTSGYAACDVNNNSRRGLVTAAHVLLLNSSKPVYQAFSSNTSQLFGTPTLMDSQYDCVFVPQPSKRNVTPYIYDGSSSTLKVTGFTGSVSNNMLVEKSGISSGFTQGYFKGNEILLETSCDNGQIEFTINRCGILEEKDYDENITNQTNISMSGDSGGPVFSKFGTNSILLGILHGGDDEGTVYFIWCTDIRDAIGVVPLT